MIGITLVQENSFEITKSIVKVGYVVPNGPADKSGMQVNDIILKVGDQEITNPSEVVRAISQNGLNKRINITIKRNKELIRLRVLPIDIRDL